MSRTRLANRRIGHRERFLWGEQDWLINVGFDRAGKVREIFLDGFKSGSDAERWIQHSCMMVSFNLQSGDDVASLLERIAGGNEDTGYAKASPVELMLRHALKLESEMGEYMRATYAALAGTP